MFKYLRKFLYVSQENRLRLFLLIFLFVFSSFLEAGSIAALGGFLGIVENPESVNTIPVLSDFRRILENLDSVSFISLLGCILCIFFAAKSLVYMIVKFSIIYFNGVQEKNLKLRLFQTYTSAPYESYLSYSSADLINKIVSETQRFVLLCTFPLLDGFANLVLLISLFILLAKTDFILLIIIALGLLPVGIIFLMLGQHMRLWGKTVSISRENSIQMINHSIGALKEVKVIGCESFFGEQLTQTLNEQMKAEILFMTSHYLPRALIESLLLITITLTISIFSFLGTVNFAEQLPSISVFAIASIRLIPASTLCLQYFSKLKSSGYVLDQLYLTLKDLDANFRAEKQFRLAQTRNTAYATRPPSLPFSKRIELYSVTYKYPSAASTAIEDVSLILQKGESIAFIGESGAGKTTLVDVLLGLLVPQTGDIEVDGLSIYNDLEAWKQLIGYIPQSIFLMDETIEHNIAFGVRDRDIDYTRLWEAIQAAQLEDLINHLEAGLQTRVGERGVRLSGGQRQRIGIARALYHQREILVLDEATSALDNETEEKVSNAIDSLAGAKTLIMIAHRLTTLKKCDRIYVLEKGRIVQSGTYQEVVVEGDSISSHSP